jgi:hypothetical protein
MTGGSGAYWSAADAGEVKIAAKAIKARWI